MRLAFATLGCPTWDLPTIAHRAAEYGYDGVELRGVDGEHVGPALSPTGRREVRALFAEAGLEIAGLMGYTRFTAPEVAERRRNEDDMVRMLDLAADLGAPLLRTFGGAPADGANAQTCYARVAESLNRVAPAAEQRGVTIILETHDAFGRGTDVAAVLAEVPSPNVGALWDVMHPYRNGETPDQTATLLGNRIVHVHIKDGYPRGGGPDDWQLVLLGEGTIPVRDAISVLARRGYTGYLSVEWEKKWHPELVEPEVAFPQHIALLRQYLAQAASEA